MPLPPPSRDQSVALTSRKLAFLANLHSSEVAFERNVTFEVKPPGFWNHTVVSLSYESHPEQQRDRGSLGALDLGSVTWQ